MKNLSLSLLVILSLLIVGCQERRPNAVPNDWVAAQDEEPSAPPPELGETVDHIFVAQSNSLEKAELNSAIDSNLDVESQFSKAATPHWHMTAFLADIGISVGGLLGSLIYKGTPSVTAVFKKHVPQPAEVLTLTQSSGAGVIQLESSMTPVALEQAMEPSLEATLATGRVKDEKVFRTQALEAAHEFQALTQALESLDQDSPWKVSRFRLDLTVEESGKITPIIGVGAELRLRFEWFRIKRPGTSATRRTERQIPNALAQNLVKFATGLSSDLAELSDDSALEDSGFKAFTYRVGLGVSRKLDIGVVTDARSLVAHLYFTRDLAKPVVTPKVPSDNEDENGLTLVDANDQVSHVTHSRFRRGLHRAMKMGAFFARYAARHPEAKWKISEIKTGFDLSLAGKTSLTGLSGIGATDIGFRNLRF